MTASSRTNRPPGKAIGPDGSTRTIPERIALHVWVAAGGRCTMCNRYLVVDEHTGAAGYIDQLTDIVGWKEAGGSPRSGDPLPVADRNEADNSARREGIPYNEGFQGSSRLPSCQLSTTSGVGDVGVWDRSKN